MLTIHRTYSEVTPESAESGEDSDSGSIGTESVTFRELVELLREHPVPSSWPTDGTRWDWFSTYSFVTDYQSLTERIESIHFDHSNPSRLEKYWRKAIQLAFKRNR